MRQNLRVFLSTLLKWLTTNLDCYSLKLTDFYGHKNCQKSVKCRTLSITFRYNLTFKLFVEGMESRIVGQLLACMDDLNSKSNDKEGQVSMFQLFISSSLMSSIKLAVFPSTYHWLSIVFTRKDRILLIKYSTVRCSTLTFKYYLLLKIITNGQTRLFWLSPVWKKKRFTTLTKGGCHRSH
jgi:hypothetical protein